MRFPALLSIFLLFAGVASGQQAQPGITLTPQSKANPLQAQPVAQPGAALDPANSRLDALLVQWEQKMTQVNALEADITRTEQDLVDKTTKTYQGRAKFLRPSRAMLYLQKSDDPKIYEHYIFSGTYLYQYLPQTKKLAIHELPAAAPGREFDENNFVSFLTGMKAAVAKQRFEITLAKEDEHYVYLYVVPKTAVDKQEFAKARMVLYKATFLPRQLEFEDPRGMVTKWDIPRLDTAAKVTTADFNPPAAPKDWKTERVPLMNQPPAGQSPAVPANPQPSKFRPAGQ